jgi:hypothetical protein
MSEETVRQWGRMFTMKSEVTGWASVVSDDPVQSVGQIFVRDGNSQFQNFYAMNFNNLRTVLYQINAVRLGHHKFCAR